MRRFTRNSPSPRFKGGSRRFADQLVGIGKSSSSTKAPWPDISFLDFLQLLWLNAPSASPQTASLLPPGVDAPVVTPSMKTKLASTPHCWAANPTAPSFLAVFFSALATNWSRSCSSSLRKTWIGPAPHAQNRRGVVVTAHVLEARTRLGQRQRTGQRRATLVRQRRIAIVVQTRVTNAIDDDASIVPIGIIRDVGKACRTCSTAPGTRCGTPQEGAEGEDESS